MKYNQLTSAKKNTAKRVGRGIAGGQGKTAGRGTKGQGARAGFNKNPGFAGGSNPLMQKLPKLVGFNSKRTQAEIVFTDQLNSLKQTTIDASGLAEAGLISNSFVRVKLLSRGDVAKPLTVKLPSASQSAIAALESSGGSFEKVSRLQRPSAKSKS